ncbi:glutathione S-transferase family protein [Kangiella sp. HZ709]|uniref:glutathione S-transferase family protein n=1 Tax=Kangiella sp. HZ709 TaxID=2666328 RepID=UPI0012AF1299|nr:glutathione S-transferase family protein [Kangiella sp. HZ709]MRX27197.1 glutathione S-transferase family protein [Kangiella sp. HZ709]
MKVYGDMVSGNCYKVALTCALLELEHEWIAMDILKGDARSEEFIAKNPNAKTPTLELTSGETLWESNAIINYLAESSDLMPTDAWTKAKVQQWQFFEQYSHEPFIAVARFINKYLGLPEDRKAEYESKQEGGHKALAIMEQQLQQTPYLVGDQLTTADISLYAYTHVAHEGGFDLSSYPAINTWMERIQQQEKYIGME